MRVLWIAALGVVLAGSAAAWDEADLSRLLESGDHYCPWCDLRGADLSGQDFNGANLRGADLEGANLRHSNLGRGADLSQVNLLGADLNGTFMNGAILCNTTMPDGHVEYSGCAMPLE